MNIKWTKFCAIFLSIALIVNGMASNASLASPDMSSMDHSAMISHSGPMPTNTLSVQHNTSMETIKDSGASVDFSKLNCCNIIDCTGSCAVSLTMIVPTASSATFISHSITPVIDNVTVASGLLKQIPTPPPTA